MHYQQMRDDIRSRPAPPGSSTVPEVKMESTPPANPTPWEAEDTHQRSDSKIIPPPLIFGERDSPSPYAHLAATNHPGPLVGMQFAIPNAVIDSCPPSAPQGYQQWRREIRLWMGAQAGATTTQLMSKIIMTLPLAVKMDALTYMEVTEKVPQSRDTQRLFSLG